MTWHPDMPLEYRNQIVTGDSRELAKRIPDESIDLVFCDPVYQNIDDYRWLAETAARVLKPWGNMLCWQGTAHLPETLTVLATQLEYKWVFSMSHSNSMGNNIIFSLGVFTHWTPLLWFAKPESKPSTKVRDWIDVPLVGQQNHSWHKSVSGVVYWMRCFTDCDSVIYDPFTGGGTVPAACKTLGRNYVASEIDPDVAERARERVRNTQPPLFVLEPEQLRMEV